MLQLQKNASINLTKAVATLTRYAVGLSWDANTDLDAVAVALGADGKIINPSDANVAYYGNCTGNSFNAPVNPVAGITHSGDARDGAAAGDDETITIDTTKLRGDIKRVLIAITSYSDGEPVTFSSAAAPVARLYDQNGKVLFEVKLDENAAFSTAVEFVEFSKSENGEWSVTNLTNPIGECSANGLSDVLAAH
ncbi:hypothetical protein [Pectobacterium phage Wc4-1]|uniref:TerD domain-containing protein n=1 Tax=Pectobacterium phage Wc4 TaxID=2652428 RepID=A0A5P8D5F1_9CAUD|nr:hypothetical protein [Pectobacterium phage Wc4]QFP94036.1 hypothetical protein [Pectobacterium phage Wc4-1]